MTQEKQEGAEAAVEPAQAKEPDPKIVEYETKIATLISQVEDAKREAKSHQEYGRKTKEALDKQQGLDSKVTHLEQRLEVATDMIADLLDKGEETLETPVQTRKSDAYRTRLANTEAQIKETQEANFKRMAIEADSLLKTIGLEMKKSPETLTAYVNFLEGNPEAGLEEVKKIVEAKNVKPEVKPEPPKESEDARIERLVKERMEAKYPGVYASDASSPGGAVARTYKEAQKAFIDDPYNQTKKQRYVELKAQQRI